MKHRRGRLAEWERLARVARALGIAERTLRRWAERGIVPARQAEPGSTIYVHAPSARQIVARRPREAITAGQQQ